MARGLTVVGGIIALLMLFTLPCTLSAEEEKIVNMYNWADYIGPDHHRRF